MGRHLSEISSEKNVADATPRFRVDWNRTCLFLLVSMRNLLHFCCSRAVNYQSFRWLDHVRSKAGKHDETHVELGLGFTTANLGSRSGGVGRD